MILFIAFIIISYLSAFIYFNEKILPFYKNKLIKSLFFNYQPYILKRYIEIEGGFFYNTEELTEKSKILLSKGFTDTELFLLNNNFISLCEHAGDDEKINKFLKLRPHCFLLINNPKLEHFVSATEGKEGIILFWRPLSKYITNEEIINKAISYETAIFLDILNPTIDNLISVIKKNPSFYTYAKIVSNPDPETTLRNLENKKKLLSKIS